MCIRDRNTISNRELSDPLCDNVNRGPTLVRLTQTCRNFNNFKLFCEAMPICSLLISCTLSDMTYINDLLNHASICVFVIVLSFSGQGGLSPESAWLQHQSPEDLLGLPPDRPHGGELPHPGYLLLPLSQGQNRRLRVRQSSMSRIILSQTYLQISSQC